MEARGLALGILATLATAFALSWAQTLLIPLLLGVVLTYTLSPVVGWLERLRIPRVAGSVLVMGTVIAALVLSAYSLRDQLQTIVEQLPVATAKLSVSLAELRKSQRGNLQKIESAATAMESATTGTAGGAARQPATHVVVDPRKFRLNDFLWESSVGAIGVVGQAAMVVFLVFFLLLGGDTFKRKLVRLAGPTLSKRKITVTILDDINRSIQQYMLMLVATNLLIVLLSWMAFHFIGIDNAGAWAVAAGLLHLVPYLGPAVAAGATAMAAFMQFDSASMALLTGGASLTIATLVGIVVTTWMTGRIAHMNAAAVFISLLFWGWLWGVWGMLLSIPIVVITKVVAQHVEPLHPLAELLGE
ncbi:MAG TPA: AI-2E family transporter [Burkholderiaceae bacterium]|nr:AI-2E family transporter [Burkholderiaceae bacterium]